MNYSPPGSHIHGISQAKLECWSGLLFPSPVKGFLMTFWIFSSLKVCSIFHSFQECLRGYQTYHVIVGSDCCSLSLSFIFLKQVDEKWFHLVVSVFLTANVVVFSFAYWPPTFPLLQITYSLQFYVWVIYLFFLIHILFTNILFLFVCFLTLFMVSFMIANIFSFPDTLHPVYWDIIYTQ